MSEFIDANVQFYRRSGKAPIRGLLLLVLAGFIGAPILGLIYGVLMRIIPIIYINIAVLIGSIFAQGYGLTFVVKSGRIRNMFLLGLAGLFFGLLAEYSSWVGWLTVLIGDPAFLLEFFFPFDILYFIYLVGQEGAWTFMSMTPTGGFLYFIWFAEACIFVGGSSYIALKELWKIPFCEESGEWADHRTQIGAFAPIADRAQFKQAVLQGNFSIFNTLKPSLPGEKHYTTVEVYECDKCRNFFVVNVADEILTLNSKGQVQAQTKRIISNLLVTPYQLETLKRLPQ